MDVSGETTSFGRDQRREEKDDCTMHANSPSANFTRDGDDEEVHDSQATTIEENPSTTEKTGCSGRSNGGPLSIEDIDSQMSSPCIHNESVLTDTFPDTGCYTIKERSASIVPELPLAQRRPKRKAAESAQWLLENVDANGYQKFIYPKVGMS